MPSNAPPPCQTTHAEAAAWLARRNNGEHSAEEQRAFIFWLNASQANREAFAKAEALWEQMRGLDAIAEQPLSEARAFLSQKRRHPIRHRFAIIILVLFAAGVAWQTDSFSYLSDQTYQTMVGENRTVDLTDGSRLELNTHSQAKVHYSRHKREVHLIQGQAVLTVAHNDHRPFELHAGNGKIHDIGTQFDVRYTNGRVSVAVLDGAVEVFGSPNAPPRQLKRGEQVSYSSVGEMSTIQAIDINTVSAWRERRLVFQGLALKDVLEELGRYHRASISVSAPKILEKKVSGVFPTDNLPQALQTIATALPLKLTQTGPQSWQLDRR